MAAHGGFDLGESTAAHEGLRLGGVGDPGFKRHDHTARRGDDHGRTTKTPGGSPGVFVLGRAPSVEIGARRARPIGSSGRIFRAHTSACLALLPSGPDAVHKMTLRETFPSTLRVVRFRQAGPLGREFSPAGADCGYRAPLAPRLARPEGSVPSETGPCHILLAEAEGFEPPRRLPPYTLSRRVPSTARPSLRWQFREGNRPRAKKEEQSGVRVHSRNARARTSRPDSRASRARLRRRAPA